MPTLVSTGQITISDVTDGLNARLSSESHLVPTDALGNDGDYTGCSTTMAIFLGKADDSSNWAFSASPTAGITGSLVGSTYTVTDMTTDAGYVDLTASRTGYPSLTSRFSITKAKRGQAGPAITLVSSAQGFTFRDNVAYPAEQIMSFTVIRQNAYGPVQFYASEGATLTTDEGQLLLSNYTIGVHGTGEGETCYLDLAGFGDNQQVTITAVVGELTATQTVVRLDSSTAEAGATVGAIWGVNVVNQPSFTDFLESFEGDASQWQNYGAPTEITVVDIPDSVSGGKALRIGNNSGNDMAWLIHKQNIAFDPNATYRIKFRARQVSGVGTAYFGLAGVAADGVTLVNVTGANASSSQHYIAASGVTMTSGWTEYVGFVKGTAATGDQGSKPSVTSPGKMHQNVKYIRPLILVNYSNIPGQAEIDYARVELLTDSVNWDTVTGAGKDTLVTTANNAATSATTANNLLADIASDSKLTPTEKNHVKREWDILVAEKSGINAQATAFGITTENSTYNTNYDTLNGYLSPLLSNMTTTSDITGSILRSNFANLYSARQALLNKIAEVASTRSNWTSVNGKPTDEQIMNVLVSQGVYNGVPFPYSGRSLYIPCYVDNNQSGSGWYKVAEAKLSSPYYGFSFVGSITWGQSSKRFTSRADLKISFSSNNPATSLSDQVFKYAGDDPSSVLKVRLSQDGNGLWIIGIYATLAGWKGLMLDGNWFTSTATASWVDDYQDSTTQLAGDPGLTNFAPSANYELGATRNVHRGNWLNSTAYSLGDTVIHGGYGWSCVTAHTSVSGTNQPPTYPTTSNTWWVLAAVKGEDAKVASLTASSFVFKVAQDGTVSPSSIALTALGQNLAGNPTFEVTSGVAVLSGTGTARTISAASLTTDQATVKVTWDGKEDFVTITKVREGTSGLTVVMTNENHTMPAANDGSVALYTGSGTKIQVYEGSTALWASSTATVSAFRIGTITQSPASTITVGAVNNMGNEAVIDDHSAMAQGTDSVTLTIPITIYRADGTSTTVNKVQTISKAKAGSSAAYVVVTGEQSFVYNAGSATPASTSITLSASLFGGLTTYDWEYWNGSAWANLSGTQNASTYTLAHDNAAWGSSKSLRVRCLSGSVFDELTIVKLYNGAAGEPGLNLLKKSVFSEDLSKGDWSSGSVELISSVVGVDPLDGVSYALKLSVRDNYANSSRIAVRPGQIVYVAGWVNTQATTKQVRLGFRTRLAGVDQNSWPAAATLEPGNGWTYISGQYVVPASGVDGLTPFIQINAFDTYGEPLVHGLYWGFTNPNAKDAYTVVLSNETHTVACASDGTPLANELGAAGRAKTDVRVWRGSTELSAVASAPTVGQFDIASITATGCTATIEDINTVRLDTLTADVGSVKLSILVEGGITVEKLFTFSKAKEGIQGVDGPQGPAGADGQGAIVAVLSNEAHSFPASSAGAVSSYTGSGTTITVYEGTTTLAYDGVGTANGTWKVTTEATNIAVGTLTDSGTYLTVGDHSDVAAGTDTSSIVYTISGKTASGISFSFTKQQSFTKSKAGANGSDGATGPTGPQGPAVRVTSNRVTSYTATDGTLDSGQTDIVFTASVSGISSPTYVWSFSGFQTAPTNSGTSTQTITAAQFGTSKSAIVTCTVNGTYVDKVTIVRLEKTTAAPGATVGADWNTNLNNRPSDAQLLNNILDTSTWRHGQWGASAEGFNINGGHWENYNVLTTMPDGSTGTVWQMIAGRYYGQAMTPTPVAAGDADGGWITDSFPINNLRPYRYSVWAWRQSGTGTIYLGCQANTVRNMGTDTTTPNNNPYFWNGSLPSTGKWYLIVGYIYPYNYGTGAQTNRGGVYDGDTGVKVYNGTDFIWLNSSITTAYHRAYQYYAADQADARFCWPRVDLMDGTEPSLDTLLSMASISARNPITATNVSTFIANAAITSAQIKSLSLVGDFFDVKSATTGQRVELDQNGGRVYDSNNVLRVRWGIW